MPSKAWNKSAEGKAWYKAYYAVYNVRNRKKLREYDKKSYDKNRDKRIAKSKRWNAEHPEQRKANKRKSYRNQSVVQRLAVRLRVRLNNAIRRDSRRGSAVKLLGCTVAELKQHLEGQFQPGMTWDNWSVKGWHIDHIIPLASFDLSDLEQLTVACHYKNLQPLWASENCSKGARVV